MRTISQAIQSRLHNQPPEAIESDTRIELRERLERDYGDMIDRGTDLELGLTQITEITAENEQRTTEFLAKQVQPFLGDIDRAHRNENSTFLALSQVVHKFFYAGMRDKLLEARKPVDRLITAYRVKQRAIARAAQLEEKRRAEVALREAQERAMRERLAAQETTPLNRSEARDHLQAARRAESEAAEAARIMNAPPDPGHVHGDYGSTGYLRDTWTCAVEDITEVPFKYISFNQKAADADIAVAVREAKRAGREPPGIVIPGVRIYQTSKFVAKG